MSINAKVSLIPCIIRTEDGTDVSIYEDENGKIRVRNADDWKERDIREITEKRGIKNRDYELLTFNMVEEGKGYPMGEVIKGVNKRGMKSKGRKEIK